MDQISFFELFASWTPELCVFGGLFAFTAFAVAVITLITAPVTRRGRAPRRPNQVSKNSALLGGLR